MVPTCYREDQFAMYKLRLFYVCIAAMTVLVLMPTSGVARGFDELGYNEQARVFNGPADGVDGILDGMVWGDPTYANDHLVMKWNAEWDRGNAENWSQPPYAAWEDNEWNGKVPD